jgi:hypothetical protein
MRRLHLAAAAAAAIALSSTAANAAALVVQPVSTLTPSASGFFGNAITNPGPGSFNFSDTFSFSIGGTAPAMTDSQVSTFLLLNSQNISFQATTGCPNCGIFVDNNTNPLFRYVQTQFDPLPETFALNPVVLSAGPHTIFVNGTLLGPTGSYSGTINVAPVPEPATWAMMLLGFAGVGMAVRRRRSPVLAQIA